jgi:phage baseplate assembly protein gpV
MHDNGEDGEILHEVPSDDQLPPSWADDDHEGVTFKDGTTIIYDNANKILTINAISAELHFNCTKLVVSGDVIAGSDNISLITHTHTTPVGKTGEPIPQI